MQPSRYDYPLFWVIAFTGIFQVSYAMMAGAWYLYLHIGVFAAIALVLGIFILFTIIASSI